VPLFQDFSTCDVKQLVPSDLAPSNMSSHILETLDDGQMGLVLVDLVTMAHRWAGSPQAWQCTPGLITHRIEDVVAVGSQIPRRDEMRPPPPWTQCPRPLMLASIG
jgi:hypothetical protein